MKVFPLRKLALIGALLFTAALVLSAASAGQSEQAVVKWVADGDTVILTDGRRLRYLGINCPETAHDLDPAEPFGEAARRMNQDLVAGRTIRFVAAGKDRYGRILAAVFSADGTFVNQALVAAGLAHVLPGAESEPFADLLSGAQREAMAAQRGFWSRLDRKPTSLVGNRRSRRFHRVDCPFAKKIGKRHHVTFPDLHQAFDAGYAPCGHCFPRLEELIKMTNDQ